MPPSQPPRHVYISCARECAADKVLAEQLRQHLTDDFNLRVFMDDSQDVHNAIALGVEHAAVAIVLSSPDYMEDKLCMKAINYADQRRVPLIHVRIHGEWQPKSWLGALLAPAPIVDAEGGAPTGDVLKQLVDTIESRAVKGLKSLKMKRGEVDLASSVCAPLYDGTQVEGQYFQWGQGSPMRFDSFILQNNRVMGEGDDEVGSFVITGEYNLKKRTISFLKQYIGQHSVDYNGTFEMHKTDIVFEGQWRIENMVDNFYLKVDLDNRENNDTPKRPALGDTVILLCHATQSALADKIAKAIQAKGIKAIVPPYSIKKMTSALARALVVCPLLEPAFQDCATVCKVALSCADANHLPIVPIKAQSGYSQSEWLGVICAGLLYQDFSSPKNFKPAMAQLLREIECHAKDGESAKSAKGVMLLCDTSSASGWYEQFEKQTAMSFSTFVMAGGRIIGEGDDPVGSFILHGTYEPEGQSFAFDKQYIGQHNVLYSGTYDVGASVVLRGRWEIPSCNYSGDFQLQAPVAPGAAGEAEGVPHVMLSYQWNSQDKVKRIAEALTEHGIRVWFDINGDMNGNINVAMAEGVEGSKCVLSFATEAYRASVNCQKELTYANQLKKPIIPVLVEDLDMSKQDWLGMIIASVNMVQMSGADFDDNFKQLTERLNALTVSTPKAKIGRKATRKAKGATGDVIFSGGSVSGRYFQGDSPSEMAFDFFSIDNGRVRGQGDDEVGPFVISGTHSGDKVQFIKEYIGQHSVQYDGKLTQPSHGSFELSGRWSVSADWSGRFEMSGYA